MKNTAKTIILDLDGVVVDFVTSAMKMWYAEGEYPESAGWDIVKACNMLRDSKGLPKLSEKQFWSACRHSFWTRLKFYPGAQDFIKTLEDRFGWENIVICTSDTLCPQSASGKSQWIATNMPRYKRQRFIGSQKWRLANPNTILVDDADHNCERFEAAGGKAVLVPRPWNSRSADKNNAYQRTLDDLWSPT